MADPLTTLFRPVGQAELDLIAATGFARFPPRLPSQPIFYPVLTEPYAVEIARDSDEFNRHIRGPIEVIAEFHALRTD